MKRRLLAIALVAGAASVLTGCATGPKFEQVQSSFPQLSPGHGRGEVRRRSGPRRRASRRTYGRRPGVTGAPPGASRSVCALRWPTVLEAPAAAASPGHSAPPPPSPS